MPRPRPQSDHHLARRLRLIVVTDARLARPRTVVEVVREALDAGAPAIQLRNKGDQPRALLPLARELRLLTRDSGALLFINDRLDVALAAGADGVHLGPNDLPVREAREASPEGFLIGASVDDPRTARETTEQGADYIGCGTVYPTSTKRDAGSVIGISGLSRVIQASTIPVVAIGGITVARVPAVRSAGAAGVAVVGAVMGASDVAAAVGRLLAPWQDRPAYRT